MEQEKILNLWNEANDSKFVTRKLNTINNNSKSNYDVAKEITYSKEILKSNFCDYNDAYILIRCDITVVAAPATQVAFKNCAPFFKCITKIDETTIEDAEDLDLVIPMYIKGFKYKDKLLGNTAGRPAPSTNGILKNATIAVPLKYLSNFWRSIKNPLINFKEELKLRRTKHCLCLQVVLIMLMEIMMIIILFLLLKTQNYMFL